MKVGLKKMLWKRW